ncbi:MAG: cyanophycinase [Acidobacteria bacterium]|nr:cyanophycinase [Acidobacteriota bacterium]
MMTWVRLVLLGVVCLGGWGQSRVVVAGGGAEGADGDTTAWSFKAYSELMTLGDVNGPNGNPDGMLKLAILGPDDFDPCYDAAGTESTVRSGLVNLFRSYAAAMGMNWQVKYFIVEANDLTFDPTDQCYYYSLNVARTIEMAQGTRSVITHNGTQMSTGTIQEIGDYDAIFIKGGDQGDYYDTWNGTLLESKIRQVVNRGGPIGGTSAGAMSQAEFCFAPGKDMISEDVLMDAQTDYMDDASQPSQSGIHRDFLSMVPGVVIDTHFTRRGRLGRLLGILAKTNADFGVNALAVGVDERTAMIVEGNNARVVGNGSVLFVHESANTQRRRVAGQPLVYTNLVADRLTEGWSYNLNTRSWSTKPSNTQAVVLPSPSATPSGSVLIYGDLETQNSKFEKVGQYDPPPYSLVNGTASTRLARAAGYTLAGDADTRRYKHEGVFRILYDRPDLSTFLVFENGIIETSSSQPNQVSFRENNYGSGSEAASIVINARNATYKGLSPYSGHPLNDVDTFHATAMTQLHIQVLADSSTTGSVYDLNGAGSGGGGGDDPPPGSISEQESNNSRSTAQDLRNASYPVTLIGTISSASDRDYFKIELEGGKTLTASLTVPSAGDYDLYFMSSSGSTLVRSTSDGYGTNEQLTYRNTSSRTKTYYIEVESYAGSSTTQTYTLQLSK